MNFLHYFRTNKITGTGVVLLCVFAVSMSQMLYAGTLSCSITTVAGCTGVVVLRMSSSTNATSELPNRTNFSNHAVCCTGVAGLGALCSGTNATVLKLSSSTNAHVEQNTQLNYPTSTCLSVTSGSVTIGYQANNCTGYDTTMLSMSSTTNAHVGTTTAYTTKVCGTADDIVVAQSLTLSLSTTTLSFGVIDPSNPRYASSTGAGSSVEVQAHTITSSSSVSSGYYITVQGQTLTSQQNASNTISSIGGVNTAPSAGTEQFGLRLLQLSGTGVVVSPYAASGFAFGATATTSSVVATGTGDGITSVFSARYVVNMAPLTEAGSYKAYLVYVAVANF